MNGFSGITGRAFLRCIKRRRGRQQAAPDSVAVDWARLYR